MAQVQLFLSTPSARRATCPIRLLPRSEQISIHALREEGDCVHRDVSDQQPDFYPRPPRGGRHEIEMFVPPMMDISIHALREEGDVGHGIVVHRSGISIHALREEGDYGRCVVERNL